MAVKTYQQRKKRAYEQIKEIISVPYKQMKSGIYLYARKDENDIVWYYCGQAVNIYERTLSHLTGFQHIDRSLQKRKFYSEENPHGWKFSVLEYCDKDKLDEREQFWILELMKKGWQTYNTTYGSQGEGKTEAREYKEAKGYRQGLANGHEQTRKEIAHLFDKYLTYDIKGSPSKLKERAKDKFEKFLKGDGEDDTSI